jgi:hypothetical protein
LGDHTPGLLTVGHVGPQTFPSGTNGLVDGSDAPSTIAMDVGLMVARHGTTEDDAGGANASLPNTNVTPARQLTRLYPLFNGRNTGSGQQNASFGRGGTAQRVSSPPAAVAAVPADAVQAGGGIEGAAVRALNTSRTGGTTGGVALRAPSPLPPRPAPGTTETAAASAATPGTAICTDGCTSGTCIDGRIRTFVPAAIIAATAPAVPNPYTNTARGPAADTRGVVGGALGALVAPHDRTPTTAGAAVAGGNPPANGYVQGVLEHSTPSTFMEEELRGADPLL